MLLQEWVPSLTAVFSPRIGMAKLRLYMWRRGRGAGQTVDASVLRQVRPPFPWDVRGVDRMFIRNIDRKGDGLTGFGDVLSTLSTDASHIWLSCLALPVVKGPMRHNNINFHIQIEENVFQSQTSETAVGPKNVDRPSEAMLRVPNESMTQSVSWRLSDPPRLAGSGDSV